MDEQVYFAVDAFIYSGYYKWGIFCSTLMNPLMIFIKIIKLR